MQHFCFSVNNYFCNLTLIVFRYPPPREQETWLWWRQLGNSSSACLLIKLRDIRCNPRNILNILCLTHESWDISNESFFQLYSWWYVHSNAYLLIFYSFHSILISNVVYLECSFFKECIQFVVDFLEVSVHQILWTRNLYPKEIFRQTQMFNVLVYVSCIEFSSQYSKTILTESFTHISYSEIDPSWG